MDTPTSYPSRKGTINWGTDYEQKVAMWLFLKCCSDNLDHFWMATNLDKWGAFDDIILYMKPKQAEGITYMIQSKYQRTPCDLTDDDFTLPETKIPGKQSKSNRLFLNIFFNSYCEIKKRISNNANQSEIIEHFRKNPRKAFVIFTNKAVDNSCNIVSKINNTSDADAIKNTGSIYKFNDNVPFYEELGSTEFLENFFLASNQPSIEDLNESLKASVLSIIKPVQLNERDLNRVAEGLISFFDDWSKGLLGQFFPLQKIHFKKKIFELLLERYMVTLEEGGTSTKQDTLWHKIIDEKYLTIIEESDEVTLNFVRNTMHTLITKSRENLRYDLDVVKMQLLRTVHSLTDIAIFENSYELLWKNKTVPLLLQVTDSKLIGNLRHILQIFGGMYKVVILNQTSEPFGPLHNFPELFATIADLDEKHQEAILCLSGKLQDRSSCLKHHVSREMFKHITVKDIVYILDNQFNIGNKCQIKPDIFIDISLQKVWLQIEALHRVKEEFFVIASSTNDFDTVLNALEVEDYEVSTWKEIRDKFDAKIILFDGKTNLGKIKNYCLTRNMPAHFLVFHNEGALEWRNSSGTTKNIKSFRKMTALNHDELTMARDVVLNFCSKQNYLISAHPGMGKSFLINYFIHEAPSKLWVLNVDLENYSKYYDSLSDETIDLETVTTFIDMVFEKHNANDDLARDVFGKCRDSKNIVLLLDGFDEIPIENQSEAKTLIKLIHKAGYLICLTTRMHFQSNLESLLDTFAYNINPFTMSNQLDFLTSYFEKHSGGDTQNEQIQSFAAQLLDAARQNVDNKFSEIPLQIALLAEEFKTDCTEFIQTNNFVNTRFDLLNLFKRLIKRKASDVKVCKDLIHSCKKHKSRYALGTLFTNDDLQGLNIDAELQLLSCCPEKLHRLQKDGVVIMENESTIAFANRTLAEYLVAEWMSKNIKGDHKEIVQTLLKKTFNPKFSVVRNIFDLFLSRKCDLHSAIINRHVHKICNFVSSDVVEKTDAGKRSISHLIASWGLHISDTTSKTDDMMEILKLIPKNEIQHYKDDVLNYNPLDYAIASGSLNIADAICSDVKTTISKDITTMDIICTLCHCFKLRYTSLIWFIFKNALNSPNGISNRFPNIYVLINPEMQIVQIIDNGSKVEQNILLCFIQRQATKLFMVNETNSDVLSASFVHLDTTAIHLPDINIGNILHWAAQEGFTQTTKLILQDNVNIETIDSSGRTALHLAAKNGHTETVKFLLSKRANIHAKCNKGETALHFASFQGHDKTVDALLLNGAKIDAKNNEGWTALHKASLNGHLETVSLLLSKGADPEVLGGEKLTPLHLACSCGRTEIINLLLAKKAKLEARDCEGWTALHFAVFGGYIEVAKCLMLKGAVSELTDHEIRNVVSLAESHGHDKLVGLLHEWNRTTNGVRI